MPNSHPTKSQPTFQWDIWWRWSIASLIGVVVAMALFNTLPETLVSPDADENIWLDAPWRYSLINGVKYAPLSILQWTVLR